ncbi:uncharacterized protein LOC135843205 [Planococcus citri]|uniref:uncharacterized protein LOC135843198 n=1 Tax=Planococcus citri TaxID=170843 RepID=UPI0031F8FE25
MNKTLSEEDRDCEAHFVSMTTRNSDGRFVLRLPLKIDRESLGHSKTQALQRLHGLELRFSRNKQFREDYIKSINDMISQGQLRRAVEKPGEISYYIPHHAVIKESSSTTKLRVVLDPTMKSSSGLSLSDCLMKGPTVQAPLMSILFRSHFQRYVFTSDIRKMYLQFLRHSDDIPLQRILWRESQNDPIMILEYTVVVFGFPSSPFEATRCLIELARKHRDQFPLASKILEEDTYVDDIYTGADTVAEAIEKRNQLIALLKLACLGLSKWCANANEIISDVMSSDEMSNLPIQLDKEISVKTLGLIWIPREDVYKVWVGQIDIQAKFTKKKVLSIISSIYDPLGFLGPVTVSCKIIMQSLWRDKLSWDSPLPEEIKKQWIKLISTLHELNKITIPRHLFSMSERYQFLELHGFADASKDAYGAVVYLRAVYENHSVVRVLLSKSRVAPLKKFDISRLELCAAELLSSLMKNVLEMFSDKFTFSAIRLWTDNTITLYWIRSPSSKWEIFVSNRVRRIQLLTKEYTWDYINTKENPADPLSRGVKPQEMKDLSLWWNGPPFLSSTKPMDPGSKFKFTQSVTLELKRPSTKSKKALVLIQNNSWMDEYVSLNEIVKVTGYQCRFFWNAHWYGPRLYGPLQLFEYNHSLLLLIKLVQKEAFSDEILCFQHNKAIPVRSIISKLSHFMDAMGIIRVGGRLQNSSLSFDQCHPILLPSSSHHLTRLIVKREHARTLHGGPTALKATLRRKYWIIHINSTVRNCITNCRICTLDKAHIRTQLMAALPKARVTPQRPFTVTGVDYAGPINLLVKKRPHTTTKAYIAVFVCFSTKAIHIELVSDLTSEAFIAAFNRFISRRGLPAEMNSDNGSTFVGAKRILSELGKGLIDMWSALSSFWTSSGVNWKFIPPYAPHFGGLWEAGVKSVKSHLSKFPDCASTGAKNVRVLRGGAVEIQVSSQSEAQKLVENLNGESLVASIRDKIKPQIVIHGVTLDVTAEMVAEAIHQETGTRAIRISEANYKKVNANEKMVFVELEPSAWQQLTSAGYLLLSWKNCRVADNIPLQKCTNCLRIGHRAKFCKFPKLAPRPGICWNCSEYNRTTKNYALGLLPIDHDTHAACCPLFRKHIINVQSNINYG